MSLNLLLPLLLAMSSVAVEKVSETGQVAHATETQTDVPAKTKTDHDTKVISGMSILGNQEAPKSLVIVPWKSSELGDSLGISTMLDDSRQPIDREVFLRSLSYYEIRSEKMP